MILLPRVLENSTALESKTAADKDRGSDKTKTDKTTHTQAQNLLLGYCTLHKVFKGLYVLTGLH